MEANATDQLKKEFQVLKRRLDTATINKNNIEKCSNQVFTMCQLFDFVVNYNANTVNWYPGEYRDIIQKTLIFNMR